MRRIWTLFIFAGLVFSLPALAYTANCGQMPGGSSCNQCFGFTLEQSNQPYDVFVPRPGLTSTEQEWIDLSQSSITASTHQNMSASPTGNITSQFTLVDHGTGNSSWRWAQMRGVITRGVVPAGIDYNLPVYSVRFVTKSNIKENGVLSTSRGATHTECAYYFLKAPVTPIATCGNNIREGSEQCDDGNNSNLDGCTNSCRFPVCGNGIIEGSESCDDNNSNNNDGCSNSCTSPLCGNGTREGVEQCDDGNRVNNDGCTNSCFISGGPAPVCNNGIIESGEQCDDGNFIDNDMCSNQCRTSVVNTGCHVQVLENSGTVPLRTSLSCSGQPSGRTVIAITKNNTVVGTFESNTTQYTFSQAGHYTVYCYPDAVGNRSNVCRTTVDVGVLCGNGIVERGEQCDDGNTISGDSCDMYCRAAGSTCGNGTRERGEQCDDGNNSNGDYCTNICQSSTPNTGPLNVVWIILGLSILTVVSVTFFRKYRRI